MLAKAIMAIPDHLKLLMERIKVPHVEDCGPHMRALNEKQRRYVCALGMFGNHKTLAYQWAFNLSNADSANAAAPRLGAQQKIKDAIKAILEFDPDAVGIVSSGYADDTVMSEFRYYGFKGVVPKPFTIAELGKAVRESVG